MERPSKRTKLLSDSEESDREREPASRSRSKGTKVDLSINKDYARRFEHNKAREEQQQLEEKFQYDDDESSTDESEDDEANLITNDLDNEIMSTLDAIRSKDPRVYNKDIKFYREFDSDVPTQFTKKEKPMTLQDYHRENLMAGYTGAEEQEASDIPQTYSQEQETLRRDIVSQMHAAAAAASADDSDDGFAVKRNGVHKSLAPVKARAITNIDVDEADKDPETYLSNFMAAQGWRAGDTPHPHAFNSDDSDDDARADAFEEAYNMRFENPATANETLKSFARDNGKYSVRRDEVGGRKKARERERAQKDIKKQEREEERARLRKLKIDDAEKKLSAIKQAAGTFGKDVDLEQWRDLLEGDFSDDAWDKEMTGRFGEQYYAEKDDSRSLGPAQKHSSKPEWDDDIDIGDIIPDFDASVEPAFTLSGDESEQAFGMQTETKPKTKKHREKERREAKAQHRRERREVEDIVDAALPVAAAQAGGFRYRETSPNSFGMDARDILFASDAQLNEYAGLRRLAAFRDETRKVKDKKFLSKKGRLRQWRKEVFGNIEGAHAMDTGSTHSIGREQQGTTKNSKRKRSKKSQQPSMETA